MGSLRLSNGGLVAIAATDVPIDAEWLADYHRTQAETRFTARGAPEPFAAIGAGYSNDDKIPCYTDLGVLLPYPLLDGFDDHRPMPFA